MLLADGINADQMLLIMLQPARRGGVSRYRVAAHWGVVRQTHNTVGSARGGLAEPRLSPLTLKVCPPVNCFPTTDQADAAQKGQIARGEPNVFFPVGNDLLGLIVTTAADGTVLAQHYSHSLHSSHSSHYSHYSGR